MVSKFGEDLALLDTGYYLSQIILSVSLGKLVEMTSAPQLYFLSASACAFLSAAVAASVVVFEPKDVRTTASCLGSARAHKMRAAVRDI